MSSRPVGTQFGITQDFTYFLNQPSKAALCLACAAAMTDAGVALGTTREFRTRHPSMIHGKADLTQAAIANTSRLPCD